RGAVLRRASPPFPTRRSSDLRLVLSWRPPGNPLRPIPQEVLAPDQDAIDSAGSRRALGWFLLAVGAAVTAGAWFLSRREGSAGRSEEHTSELHSRVDLVCRLL